VSEPLTESEVEAIVSAYAQGAADAMRLGFDGIELHGAHGYLIDQFFWERTNQRTDRYGGDFVARTRFAVDVVRACRASTSATFPIVLRYSQWKLQDYDAKLVSTPEDLSRLLAPLVAAGVDAFHCSTRRFWLPEFEGSTLNLAGWTKKVTGRPTITVGSVGLDNEFMSSLREGKPANQVGFEAVIQMIDRGEVDLVAVGRALLVDPAWAEKIRDGRLDELLPFTPEASRRCRKDAGHTTGRHRKNHAASSACPAAKAPATCHSRARGRRIASQKNTGNSRDVKRPSEMNRCATAGGKILAAIQTPYAPPNRRVTGRIAAAASTNAAISPR
jgi:2,4-dienoyl-CoA reductase-like NADH-dependent reductase (Old Yellow Enzyme family)